MLPDLRGLSAREALRTLAKLGLTPRLQGKGVVVEQNPPAGAPLERGMTCTLTLDRDLLATSARIGDAAVTAVEAFDTLRAITVDTQVADLPSDSKVSAVAYDSRRVVDGPCSSRSRV